MSGNTAEPATPAPKAKKMNEMQVVALIDARIKLSHLFTSKGFNQKEAWRQVQELSKLPFTTEQIKNKWNNLTKKYKELISPPTGKGTEDGEHTPENWIHYDKMHAYMQNSHTCYPPLVVNSSGDIVVNERNSFSYASESQAVDDQAVEYLEEFAPENIPPGLPSGNDSPIAGTSKEPARRSRKRRLDQQDLLSFFMEDQKRKKKESRKYLSILKSIAGASNIPIPDSSDSDSD